MDKTFTFIETEKEKKKVTSFSFLKGSLRHTNIKFSFKDLNAISAEKNRIFGLPTGRMPLYKLYPEIL